MKALIVTLGIMVLAGAAGAKCDQPWATFALLDLTTSSYLSCRLPQNLVLEASADSGGFGATVSVFADSLPADNEPKRNLLYDSSQFHGPHPSQFYAWSTQQQLFPDTRELQIYSTDYELKGEILDPAVIPDANHDHPSFRFTHGNLRLTIRKKTCSQPNPQQAPPTDIVCTTERSADADGVWPSH